ncbi:MAG: hypothetical protein ACI9SK_000940 [Zhongshania sp.]
MRIYVYFIGVNLNFNLRTDLIFSPWLYFLTQSFKRFTFLREEEKIMSSLSYPLPRDVASVDAAYVEPLPGSSKINVQGSRAYIKVEAVTSNLHPQQ